MGALCVSTRICRMSTVIHSGHVNHSHHSQSIFYAAKTGTVSRCVRNAARCHCSSARELELTKMSIVLPVCPRSSMVCLSVLNFFPFCELFSTVAGVAIPQWWNVE